MPDCQLGCRRRSDAATATASLGPLLELDTVSEQDFYAALDWLLSQQSCIESISHNALIRCEARNEAAERAPQSIDGIVMVTSDLRAAAPDSARIMLGVGRRSPDARRQSRWT